MTNPAVNGQIAHQGQWVQVRKIILTPSQRSQNLPEDTRQVPMEMRVKGFLVTEKAKVGDMVVVETMIGRCHEGLLCAINPVYEHDFGRPVPALLTVGKELREKLRNV